VLGDGEIQEGRFGRLLCLRHIISLII
jgi:hypothetical protein